MKHHPDIKLLLSYASGQLSPALSLAIGLHVQHCEVCQQLVHEFEMIGGEMLDVLPDAEVSPNGFNQLLKSIESDELSKVQQVTDTDQAAINQPSTHPAFLDKASIDKALMEKESMQHAVIAESEHSIFKTLQKQQFDDLNWEKITGRIRKATIAMNDSIYEVSVLKLAANTKIPKHTHCGSEYTLVLQGDFKDKASRYGPGEFVYQDESHEHQPIAGKEGCVCLTVTDGPMKFTGTFGAVFNWFAH